MAFSDRLLNLRKERGITQEQLAENLCVSRQAVAKWEVGQASPDISNLIQLSDYYRVSLDWLVKEQNETCGFSNVSANDNTSLDALLDFLLKAKKATYAAKGAEVQSSRPGSHDLQYSEGGLLYYDTFLGSERFSGEEAVWSADQPVWAMNYSGRVIADGFSGDFLKEALLRVPREYPFRGPLVYCNGDYSYHCMIQGEFSWFSGFEEIFCRDIKTYECAFHGGIVK